MDLQKLVNVMNETASRERGKYHLTLGDLVSQLENANPEAVVFYDTAVFGSPSAPISYRGYYSDLSFPPSDSSITVKELLAEAEDAVGKKFEGYKGGNFTMHTDTPLWASPYGSANGVAIMGVSASDGRVVLLTKEID